MGACNPPLAFKALSTDPLMGLMLPCNVTVEADPQGGSLARLVNPETMLATGNLRQNETLRSVAEEARARLERVACDLAEEAGVWIRSLIHGLKAHGILGVHDYERHTPREILIDLKIYTDTRTAGASDRVEDSVDYSRLSSLVKELAETAQRGTVEALAEDIARLCLAQRWRTGGARAGGQARRGQLRGDGRRRN